jgi:peptidoglycan/LPS O-acetylase OafA/YrhL
MAYFNKTKPASLSMLVVGYSWFAFFYATIMVIALTQTRSLLARFLRNRWLMRLGAIAYGTYLIHVVVFAIVMTLVRKHANVYWTVGDLTASLLSIALSIGIAQISWVIYEKRFVRWGRKLQY